MKKVISHPRFFPFYLGLTIYLAGCTILRIILEARFGLKEVHFSVARMWPFLIGLRMDLMAAAWLFLFLILWLVFLPNKLFHSKPHKIFFFILFGFLTAERSFLFIAEYNFFEEFNARFNTVAVDYLIYPHEVFINIWDSYPVGKIIFLCAIVGIAAGVLCHVLCKRSLIEPCPFKTRISFFGLYLLMGVLATFSVSTKTTRFSTDRVMEEIANNGSYSFLYAAYTRHLDYPAFYETLPREEAYSRSRKLISQMGTVFTEEPDSIVRTLPAVPGPHPKNLVILLIESFGSDFWGSLGRKEPTLTPYMDKLSEEGLLFTNLYACGNRTVRGMEGVLSSFPPLPGDSIIKRNLSDHVATLARTLKTQNYNTVFLYGGRGIFDGMRSFAVRNGFDRFIEQKNFPHPTFTTIWGVCDEDLYKRGIEELRALHNQGSPFFATLLSVSNHKPYTYPAGRIAEDPNQHSRSNAVKYTDWALGQFFEMAKKEDFYKDTVFAVVADHGARVYGSQQIPIYSYRIPLLIVGDGLPKKQRPAMLGSSLDVGPTLLGFLGRDYTSIFFGRDLLKIPPNGGWAVMNHNRDIGLYKNGRLVVLGLNKKVSYYFMDPATRDLKSVAAPTAEDKDLEKDAAALFQVADELYTSSRYHID